MSHQCFCLTGRWVPFRYQHKEHGLTIFPLLGPMLLDLRDKKEQISFFWEGGGGTQPILLAESCEISQQHPQLGWCIHFNYYASKEKMENLQSTLKGVKRTMFSSPSTNLIGNKSLFLFGKYFGYVYGLSSYWGWNLDLSQRFVVTKRDQFSEEVWSAYKFGLRVRVLTIHLCLGMPSVSYTPIHLT